MEAINFQVVVPASAHATARDLDEIRAVMPGIVSMLFERQALRRQERRAEFVDLMMKDVPMRSVDKRIAKLQARAIERIYKGSEWLTAEQIGEFGGHGTANLSAAAHRWKERKLVFALRHDRRDMYPRYAFGDDFAPLPALKDILEVFGNASPTRIAGWFESTSSFLGGRRPREVLATSPELVVGAASDFVSAEREPA